MQIEPTDSFAQFEKDATEWELLYGWQYNNGENTTVYEDRTTAVYEDRAGMQYYCAEVSNDPHPLHNNVSYLFHTEVKCVRSSSPGFKLYHFGEDRTRYFQHKSRAVFNYKPRFDVKLCTHNSIFYIGTSRYYFQSNGIALQKLSPYSGFLQLDRRNGLCWTPYRVYLWNKGTRKIDCGPNDGCLWAVLQKAKVKLSALGGQLVADRHPSVPRIRLHPGRNFLTVFDHMYMQSCGFGIPITLNHLRYMLGHLQHSLKLNQAKTVATYKKVIANWRAYTMATASLQISGATILHHRGPDSKTILHEKTLTS